MAILSFLGGVNIAHRQVTEAPDGQYPDAELLEVQARPPDGTEEAVSSPDDLGHIRCIFKTMHSGTQGTVFIESTDWWSDFNPPSYVAKRSVGNRVISWIPEGLMEATEADKLMKEAGYTKKYLGMKLRYPSEKAEEEVYIFQMEDKHTHVVVGAKTGIVTVEQGDDF